jgi:hypothetical protein
MMHLGGVLVLSVAVIPERLSILTDMQTDGALKAGSLHVLALHVKPQVCLSGEILGFDFLINVWNNLLSKMSVP